MSIIVFFFEPPSLLGLFLFSYTVFGRVRLAHVFFPFLFVSPFLIVTSPKREQPNPSSALLPNPVPQV